MADTRSIVPNMRWLSRQAPVYSPNGMAMREDSLDSGWVMDLQEALQEPLLALRIEKHFGKIVPPES